MIPHECKYGRLEDFFGVAKDSDSPEYPEVVQFFKMCGMEPDSDVYHVSGARGEKDIYKHGIEIEPGRRQLMTGSEWWEIFTDEDDFSVAVYFSGKPKGGLYISTRGSLYQAGCYIVDEEQMYWSNNISREGGTWEKGESISGDAAHDWVLGHADIKHS